ncbi:MAG: GMC oxidoreductase [Edaphobacter sp.]|uniref:GMC oxidoreductase n=1 Tax=Edaphobacter sp. TaxID=1934404 RepID=UPI002980ED33|nr:GMC oxidoreductase [Edaphobacter sp.]MDW5265513.1 GMC oxidoreductase [Edaphobacter sp.]
MKDVVIVGCGLVGAAAATCIAGAGARVTLIDSGFSTAIGPGRHISQDPRLHFGSEIRSRLTRGLLHQIELTANSVPLARGAEFAIGIGAGGAGLVWSGVTERLDSPTTLARLFLQSCVEPGYDEAEGLLGVTDSVEYVDDALATQLPGVRALRCAIWREGPTAYTPGPADVLAHARGGCLDIRHGRLATSFVHKSGKVARLTAVNVRTKEIENYRADAFVIAADAIRSPSLLVASGLEPEQGFPVGHWFTDHPLATTHVYAETSLGRKVAECLQKPEGTTICRGIALGPGPHGAFRIILSVPSDDVNRPLLAFYWYAVGNPNPANRLLFDRGEIGDFSALRPRIEIAAPMAEAGALDALVKDLGEVASEFGSAQRGWKPRLLPLGSAMHAYGTLRAGLSPDQNAVTDADGRVRGFSNLFVVGSSRLPAPSAVNPAFASIAGALVTAHRIIDSSVLASVPSPKSDVQKGQLG